MLKITCFSLIKKTDYIVLRFSRTKLPRMSNIYNFLISDMFVVTLRKKLTLGDHEFNL